MRLINFCQNMLHLSKSAPRSVVALKTVFDFLCKYCSPNFRLDLDLAL